MTNLSDSEIKPGLIMFLNNVELRALSDCRSNAADASFDVKFPHSFLVVRSDDDARTCVAFHMMSSMTESKHRIELIKDWKKNFPGKSKEKPSYLYELQSWEIPYDTFIRAAKDDKSNNKYRRTWGLGHSAELERLSTLHDANPNERRIVSPLPQKSEPKK